jgi:hypothetical protein
MYLEFYSFLPDEEEEELKSLSRFELAAFLGGFPSNVDMSCDYGKGLASIDGKANASVF